MEAVVALLNPNSFWNVALAGGIMMMVLTETPIRLPGCTIPQFSPRNRKKFFVVGLLLLFMSLIAVFLTNFAGLVSPMRASMTDERAAEMPVVGFTAAAYAQEVEAKKVEDFRLVQRSAHELKKLGDISVYLGDVHFAESAHLMVFRTPPGFQPKEDLEYEPFKGLIPADAILLDGEVKDGQKVKFSYQGQEYTMDVRLLWYLIGSDFGKIKVYKP
jgi:hypothetical protein